MTSIFRLSYNRIGRGVGRGVRRDIGRGIGRGIGRFPHKYPIWLPQYPNVPYSVRWMSHGGLGRDEKDEKESDNVRITDKINEKIDNNLEKNTKIGIDRTIKLADNITQKVSSSTMSDENKEQFIEKVDTIRSKSLKFMKKYGYVGLANYWLTWGGVFATSYLSFRHGLIDYQNISWLPRSSRAYYL